MGSEMGRSRRTPRPHLFGCHGPAIQTSSSGPRSRTRMSRFRAARLAVGPVRIAARAARSGLVRARTRPLPCQKRKSHRGVSRWLHAVSALRAGQTREAAPPGNWMRLAHSGSAPATSFASTRLLSAFFDFSRMTCSRRMTRATLSDESTQYATTRRLSIENRVARSIASSDLERAGQGMVPPPRLLCPARAGRPGRAGLKAPQQPVTVG